MYVKRISEPALFSSFERPFVTALLGPRRVGKTTLVTHYCQQHPDRHWAVFNMDVLSQRRRVANEELHLMIEESVLRPLGQDKVWVVIDEAQKCVELFEQVKILYDRYKDQNKIKFILTGSAHLDLHHLSTESLAGRIDLHYLREFNLREAVNNITFSDPILTDTAFHALFSNENKYSLEQLHETLRPFNKILNDTLRSLLIWGGLPEVLKEKEPHFQLKYLGNYLQTYLEKDIRSIDSISDLALYHHLIQICAEQTGSIRDDKKIIEALHCARNTLNKYRGYLESTLQYTEIYPYIDSSVKRLIKSPKGYVTNNGLVSYLTGVTELSILNTTGLIGHRFENWFLNELLSWQNTTSEHHKIYYWRTSTGMEVDFIAVQGNLVIPFEITYSSQIQAKKVRHLRSFLENEPKAKVGVYVYMGDFQIEKASNIIFLPAWML